MRESVYISRPKHKTSAQLKRVLSQLMLLVAGCSGAISRDKIVPPQQMKNIPRAQLQGVVGDFLFINQEWERDAGFLPERPCVLRITEADRCQGCASRPELLFMRAQLRDVLAAEDSTVVPQEEH